MLHTLLIIQFPNNTEERCLVCGNGDSTDALHDNLLMVIPLWKTATSSQFAEFLFVVRLTVSHNEL